MPKKALVFTLTLALAAALFTGCWNNNPASSSASSSRPSASSSMSDAMSGSGSMSGSDTTSGAMDDSGSMGGSMAGSMPASSDSMNNSSSAAAPAAAGVEDAWAVRLVNGENPLPENFEVQTVSIHGYENRLFDARAAQALETMLQDAEQAGHQLYLVSSYRSVARQAALFQRKTNVFMEEGFDRAQAEKQAAQWVARPGTSEHNLGLAADLVSADWYQHHDDLTADFEQTPHFTWLSEHCADYGFILRYPKGKENITGVTYEPWHYRYVGKEAATAIMAVSGTLEEYAQGKI